MGLTKIEWAKYTFNPWWGCTKVSPGCKFCYAEALDNRHSKDGGHWGKGAPRRLLSDANWKGPETWNRKAEKGGVRDRVFCGSMCDIMEEAGPLSERLRLWELIEATPNLIWMLLTKHPDNYGDMLPVPWLRRPLTNVWLGTSVENQEYADLRLYTLLRVPAALHFVSYEPALGPVNWEPWLEPEGDRAAIRWIIQGGESDPYGLRSKRTVARAIHPDWIRSTRDQCAAARIPFLFKQWGEFGPAERGAALSSVIAGGETIFGMKRMGKKAAGNIIDGRQHLEVPEY